MRTPSRPYFWLTVLSMLSLLLAQGYFVVSYYQQDSVSFEDELQALVAEEVGKQVDVQRQTIVAGFEQYLLNPEMIHMDVVPHWGGEGFTYALHDIGQPLWAPQVLLNSGRIPLPDTVGYTVTPEEMAVAFGEDLLSQMETGILTQWTTKLDEDLFFIFELERLDTAALTARLQRRLAEYGLDEGFALMVAEHQDSLPPVREGIAQMTTPIQARVTGVREYVQVGVTNPQMALLLRSLGVIGLSLVLVLLSAFTFYRLFKGLMREKRLGELKDDFINNVTHELQTPLSTIRVAVEAAQRHAQKLSGPPPARDYLGIAMQETEHLSGMIDHLLEVRMLGREGSFHTEAVAAGALLSRCVEAAQLAAVKPLRVRGLDEDAEGPWVLADPLHLAQVLHNLLDNALKYGPAEGVEISVAWHTRDAVVELTVQDNGPGIAPEHQDLIFDRFYRVPEGLTREVRGLGLGLYYVKTALQQMQGDIAVVPGTDTGTAFMITLHRAGEAFAQDN